MQKYNQQSESERTQLRDMGIIYITEGIDETSASDLIADIAIAARKHRIINVVILSGGGSVLCGMGIVRAIREGQQNGIRFIGHVYGHAQSMAFVILQACDERIMGYWDILMTHGITLGMHGDARAMDTERDMLLRYIEMEADFLVDRCGRLAEDGAKTKDKQFWIDSLRDSLPVYFFAEDAKKMGLIDEVV